MPLVFWVLWRLRWLNARETFAAVRLPIPGAVPSSAAVMAFCLRSFEADKLKIRRAAERRRILHDARHFFGASRTPLLRATKRDREPAPRLETRSKASLLHCSSAQRATPCIIRAAAVVFEDL